MNNKFTLNDFSSFDKMIAPSFLTILYYIQMGACILASIWFIFKGMDTNFGGGMMVVAGLANLVFAPLLTRLLYEFIIVIFKIHSRLVNIDLNTSDKKSVQPSFAKQAVNDVVSVPVIPNIQTQVSDNQQVTQPEMQETRQDFWNAGNGEPQFTKPDLSSVSLGNLGNLGNLGSSGFNGTAPNNYSPNKIEGFDLKDISQKVPNWKLTLASFIVLIGIMGSYANAGGFSFSIKDSAFGMFALIAAVAMVAISAMSMKWMWYIGSFSVTLVGTILALFDDKSIFSAAKKVNGVADVIGSFSPQANAYLDQARANAPSATSYLSFSFYLMILAMIYCGYCIVNGQYKERIAPPQNN
jgi:Domain of unknown function (DUF4282)